MPLESSILKYFKQINFSTLNIKGEYFYDTFVFEKFDLVAKDNAVLSILGSLDIKNIFNSDLNINGNNLFRAYKYWK